MYMNCPNCKLQLEKTKYKDIELDRCPQCQGVWFGQGELEKAKGESDPLIDWIHVDLFRDIELFHTAMSEKKCPKDDSVLHEVRYDGSEIYIEACPECKGVWLDPGEYKKIVAFLRDQIFTETAGEYVEEAAKEVGKMIIHPEDLPHEAHDLGLVIRLLEYRIAAQWPKLEDTFRALWYASPK